MTDDFVADVTSVAALSEPVRRRLYRYVVSKDAPVSRRTPPREPASRTTLPSSTSTASSPTGCWRSSTAARPGAAAPARAGPPSCTAARAGTSR